MYRVEVSNSKAMTVTWTAAKTIIKWWWCRWCGLDLVAVVVAKLSVGSE